MPQARPVTRALPPHLRPTGQQPVGRQNLQRRAFTRQRTPPAVLSQDQMDRATQHVKNSIDTMHTLGFAQVFYRTDGITQHGITQQRYGQLNDHDKKYLDNAYQKGFRDYVKGIPKGSELEALNQLNLLLRSPEVPDYIKKPIAKQASKLAEQVVESLQKTIRENLSDPRTAAENLPAVFNGMRDLNAALGKGLGIDWSFLSKGMSLPQQGRK